MAKVKRIDIRVDGKTKSRAFEIARIVGITVSELIRRLIDRASIEKLKGD